MTEKELDWVCGGCAIAIYEALPRDVSYDGDVANVEATLIECQTR